MRNNIVGIGIALGLIAAACSKSPPREAAKAVETERGAGAAEKAAKAPKLAPSADLPKWAALDLTSGEPAQPAAWAADAKGRPTLAVFSASWCPGCTASALADRQLVRDHGDKYQIGVALTSESDDAFSASRYAKALTGVPVWSESSVAKMTDDCHPVAIPNACLYAKGKVLWKGDPAEAPAILEAHAAGKLQAWLDKDAAADGEFDRLAKEALADPSKIASAVALTHGRAGYQNSVAWDLVDRDQVSPGAAKLAVELARDAVAFDGGVDFAHLDTYALALAKAGRMVDAAYVGTRVIAVCDAIQGKCGEERRRAEEFIAAANAM